jgi:3-phosphoshikimate 1-carboxyvinyltransferase
MLPDAITLEPVTRAVHATIAIPGSKSITNRALILAALSSGTVILTGALWSEDTQVMVEALRTLGYDLSVTPDAAEPANRTLHVVGRGAAIPPGGSREAPRELFVGNAGTAARFLLAMVCLGSGYYRLRGVPRMHQRPQAALLSALRELGYVIESSGDFLPALVHGGGPRPGARCTVSVAESSQFASALILAQACGQWHTDISDANDDELPYVEMTRQLTAAFPSNGGEFIVEPDASSASYFWGADWLLRPLGGQISLQHAPTSGWQMDERFRDLCHTTTWPATISRQTDLADSIMTAIVLAPFAANPVTFTDLGRLRVQECERVAALRTELLKCGACVTEHGDSLTIKPGPLHGAAIETYDDHRVAMCFALVGLRVPGIVLRHPNCIVKTFPNFFAKLAAPPPRGCGISVRNLLEINLHGDDLLAFADSR